MTESSTSPSSDASFTPAALSPLDRSLRTLTLALLLAAITSLLFSPLHWTLNLTVHMQAHLLVAALLLSVLYWWRGNRSWFAVCLMIAISLSVSVRPWTFWWPRSAVEEASTASNTAPLRLLYWNVYSEGVDAETLMQLVESQDVDVVALLELSGELRANLDPLRESYPVHQEIARHDSFGIGLYSRIPGVIARRRLHGEVDAMILRTAPNVGPWVDVWAVHTLPPVGRRMYESRNVQLAQLAQRLMTDRSVPQIVGGDFNITPWSLRFREFLRIAELRDSSHGFGYQATWPSPLGPFGIPIDHVAVDRRLEVLSHQVLRASRASDHAAVLLTLQVSGSSNLERSPDADAQAEPVASGS